jgi:hypothetical protein
MAAVVLSGRVDTHGYGLPFGWHSGNVWNTFTEECARIPNVGAEQMPGFLAQVVGAAVSVTTSHSHMCLGASIEEAHNERRSWTTKKDLGTLVLKVDGVNSGFKRSREQVASAARNLVRKLKKQRSD